MSTARTIRTLASWLVPQSLSSRVYGLYIVTLSTFVIASALAFYSHQFNDMLDDAHSTADLVLSIMATPVGDSAVVGDYDAIQRTLLKGISREQFSEIQYIDAKGGRLRAANATPVRQQPPSWLLSLVRNRIYPSNHNISIGGLDYGVLRLTLSPEVIAGSLWDILVIALLIGVSSLVSGALIIWWPLNSWLRTISTFKQMEQEIQAGQPTDLNLLGKNVPEELRELFALLSSTAASLREQLEDRNKALAALQHIVGRLESPDQKDDGPRTDIPILINHISKLVDEREASRLEAEAASRSKSEFLAVMSHEIRTPMNGILGMAQLLESPSVDENRRAEYVKVLIQSGNALRVMLDDILDLAKIEAGKLKLANFPVSIADTTRETVVLHRETALRKGLDLKLEFDPQLARRYLTDEIRLRQMLSNLVNNAIKFTAVGQVAVSIKKLREEGRLQILEFSVSDTGIGIDAKDIESLFQNFQQVDRSATRKHGGTGLGLAIVRKLCSMMGGECGVTSTLGLGSRFWFTIKTNVVEERVLNPPPADGEGPQTAIERTGKGAVLIVEDEPNNQLFLGNIVKRMGFTPVIVGDGEKAVELCRSGIQYRFILMDMRLPKMDGLAATREIRQWEQGISIEPNLIFAVTANAYDEDRQRCLDAGMDDFLAKPVLIKDLSELLYRWRLIGIPLTDASLTNGTDGAKLANAPTERVRPLLAALKKLASTQAFDALLEFRHLSEATKGTTLAPAVTRIGDALNALQFEQAIQMIEEVEKGLGPPA